MLKTQNNTCGFVQDKLSKYSKKVGEGFSKPHQKFFKDILFGLCSTGSPSIHNISKNLQDNVSTKSTSERLYRNLKDNDFVDELEAKLIKLAKPYINENTIFIVDETDIEKPYAKKMEGLQCVYNGSKGESTNGYVLMNIVAYSEHKGMPMLFPIYSRLIASKEEKEKSVKQYMMEIIEEIAYTYKGKGTFVFDRGFDHRNLIEFLQLRGIDFVIRGVGKRAIKEGCKEINFKKAISEMDFKYELPGMKMKQSFRCATRRIHVRTDDHPSKKSQTVEITLVVSRSYVDTIKKGKDFYLLCSNKDSSITELQYIAKVMDIYNKRWSIEEVHRQMKQSMKWEDMRLHSYQGMKNLNAFMVLALFFIYTAKTYINTLAIGFPKILYYTGDDLLKPKEFIYYRIAELISMCLNLITIYGRRLTKIERIDRYQMKIRFG